MSQEEKDKELALALQHQLEQESMFAVEPITNCPHIPIPIHTEVHINQHCQKCGDNKENWQCLTCGVILCSRYRQAHMQEHVQEINHYVCLSYSDLSLWCFKCESYITHESLDDLKYKAYLAKFGHAPPNIKTRQIQVSEQAASSSSYNPNSY
ncbi:hypothetical protein BJ944DRAFT_263621 [Cunninghamella echinulata]|nr:hypothetical protein BJ944DRAFT_263621 [Cunninghamella echinulata]